MLLPKILLDVVIAVDAVPNAPDEYDANRPDGTDGDAVVVVDDDDTLAVVVETEPNGDENGEEAVDTANIDDGVSVFGVGAVNDANSPVPALAKRNKCYYKKNSASSNKVYGFIIFIFACNLLALGSIKIT